MPINRHQAIAVGTAPVMIASVDNSILNETQTVWGMTFANVVGTDIRVSLSVTDGRGNTVMIFKDVLLPAQNMFGIGEDAFNFVLMPGDKVYVSSDTAAAVDVTLTTRTYV